METTLKRQLGNKEQLCSARKYVFADGPEKGQEIIEADNGKLHFMINASRAMDLGQLRYRGTNVSFISRNGFYGAETEFGSRFPAGMLYTCGLDSLSVQENHAVHGRFHSVPAKVATVRDGESIEVTGTIRQTALFGESLIVTRTIQTGYLSNELKITDVIENDGFIDAHYVLLYHVNFGYPFLTEKTYIEAPVLTTDAITPYAEDAKDRALLMELPGDDTLEKCFYHTVKEGKVKVVSPSTGLQAEVAYDHTSLQHLVEWRSMVSGAYALGIEPSTSRFFDELQYLTLKPGEKKELTLTLTIKEL